MSKRWMGIAVLLVLLSVPAAYAAEPATSSSTSIFQFIRHIISQISAMIPPTGNEQETPVQPGGNP